MYNSATTELQWFITHNVTKSCSPPSVAAPTVHKFSAACLEAAWIVFLASVRRRRIDRWTRNLPQVVWIFPFHLSSRYFYSWTPIFPSPPCYFFPFLLYPFISEKVAASFQFADHPPFQLTLLILNHPIFPAALSLVFWIFQVPRENNVRGKAEWKEGKRRKRKSNVTGMGEGIKVTYWRVDQSGCVPRLDMRGCQKEAIFIPVTFVSPFFFPHCCLHQ
jgi:hypothetical protein